VKVGKTNELDAKTKEDGQDCQSKLRKIQGFLKKGGKKPLENREKALPAADSHVVSRAEKP
jgi:hypothetical protein